MLLWLCFAFLTAAVVAMLLRPLRAGGNGAVAPAEADLAVYRDQLRELEAERERGLIGDSDVEGARAEVARRLIKRANAGPDAGPAAPSDPARARTIYTAVAIALPVLAIGLYVFTGSPQLPARPFAERQSKDIPDANQAAGIVELIQRVEARLREDPQDGKGWNAIAPVYLRLGRFADAAHAFAEANRLEGETVRRLTGFAEATLMAENGIVTEPVRRATLRILELEPSRIEVRVWLALAKEQDGDLQAAAAEYRDILTKSAADAPWRKAVSDRLALVEKRIAGVPDEPKPSAAAPAAAAPSQPQTPGASQGDAPPDIAKMSPAERDAFIASMVGRLADRLEKDGKDLDGWLRLARAYKVLGKDDEARGALKSARTHFATETAALAEIDKAEQALSLPTKE
ncbi:MAG: c-type cytochrome biogenesis protein CcmI [Hyphomicrobium sp.]|jgi:cytochrome c-type biogenesis protein CcmH|uniref:c-type cytochrome biogenesis protein CcmI n=2 Tax=Hyphomicrobium TaxID=81 RepID=UPI0025C1D2C4|nr:c-type cytochrome biogenesis protein CcmI [Hyphomicrobium sp.]MBX9861579.1 c-type cytochrome biogenesis protein CcmI [Hyphomicrobium sp.]